jgi:glycosyltransferase involved in cell wall biosynthesis
MELAVPEVSVIIPAYNAAAYIGQALESAFAQTFQDFEVLVVDDGSTDETASIVASFGDRVNYLRQDNAGSAKARNLGIRKSRGLFIAFLDADDLWLPDKLARQVALMREQPEVGMVFTKHINFDETGATWPFRFDKRLLMEGDVARNIFMRSGVGTPTVMVRREVFETVGLFEESLRQGQDDNMWVRIAAHCQVRLIDEPLVKVRNHSGRVTRDLKKNTQYVLASTHLLCTHYGRVVADRIGDLADRKLARAYFDSGYIQYENGNLKEARKDFRLSIRHDAWRWKNYLYWIVCLLPSWLVKSLRRLKWKIKP